MKVYLASEKTDEGVFWGWILAFPNGREVARRSGQGRSVNLASTEALSNALTALAGDAGEFPQFQRYSIEFVCSDRELVKLMTELVKDDIDYENLTGHWRFLRTLARRLDCNFAFEKVANNPAVALARGYSEELRNQREGEQERVKQRRYEFIYGDSWLPGISSAKKLTTDDLKKKD